MTALVYGFVRAGSSGWSGNVTVAAFTAAAALLGAFVLVERRAAQPIMPLRLFASLQRTGAYVARLLTVGGMFSFFFFETQFLQEVRDYSALRAGIAFLPMTVTMFMMTRIVPKIVPRFGDTPLVVGGLALALAAMAWASHISTGTPYFPQIAVPMVMLGLGIGGALIPMTSAGIAGVEPADSGAASGLVNAFQQVGGSLGIAVLITVFGAASRAAARHPAAGVPAHLQATDQFAHAIASSLTGSAVFLALGLAVVLGIATARRLRSSS
jgi:predicted MFS family arabinose efflux permease